MTLLETPRSRTVVVATAIAVVAAFCFLFVLQVVQVRAAKRAILAEDARIDAELASTPPTPHPGATPVLVELFTSEGCSSCPPADALLAHLLKDEPVPNADIIVLGEHVDYWDSLGWHDRFSSHQLTERQSTYAQRLHLDSPYTPQMVVDGTDQFVGNDNAHALRAIAQSARIPKLALTLSTPSLGGSGLNLSVSSPHASTLPTADIVAVLIETTASTQVARGENGGRTLHHVSVVRSMQKIGTTGKLASPLFFSFALPTDANIANLRVVVFAQEPGQGKVLGSATSTAPAPPY